MESNPVSAALASEMKAFCAAHSLTPRETDILSSLVEGVVRIKDIAVRMGLSPNTVNNHVNSIFVKTKARSKSQLLSYLLTYVAEELQATRALRRRPRVAVVDADGSAANTMATSLAPQGFETKTFSADFPMRTWPEGLAAFKPEFIVVDQVSMSPTEIMSLLDQARNMIGAQVVFCGQVESSVARRTAMAAGAIDWTTKPCEAARLGETLMAHAISAESDANTKARAIVLEKRASPFKKARETIVLTTVNMGVGGLYLPVETLKRAVESNVETGDWLELNFSVENRPSPISARGQVVWHAADGDGAGAGIRFTYMDSENQNWFNNYVREKGIRSYIPGGTKA